MNGSVAATMEVVLRARVPFDMGLHVREAARIAEICRRSEGGEVTVSRRGVSADARSVVALLSLGAQRGDEIEVRGHGPGGVRAVDEIHALFHRAESGG